jgi:hypothetical protein
MPTEPTFERGQVLTQAEVMLWKRRQRAGLHPLTGKAVQVEAPKEEAPKPRPRRTRKKEG